MQVWDAFEKINNNRRAVRNFSGEDISDEDIKVILSAGQLAPSSFNLQPYELHWVRTKDLCREVAKACNNQQAATSASTFIIVVSTYKNLTETYNDFLNHLDTSGLYEERTKSYYKERQNEIQLLRFLKPVSFFEKVRALLTTSSPRFILAPFGHGGMMGWAVKNSTFVSQTLLHAATARGYDSCPMEGFNPSRVSKILGLRKRGYAISLVIALGKRNPNKTIDVRWRQSFDKIIKVH